MKAFVLFAAKLFSGSYLLDKDERDLEHFSSLIIYILSTDLSALVGYHFVFFSFCAKHRYEALVSHAKRQLIDFEYRKCPVFIEQNIKVVESMTNLHSQMTQVFQIINEVFSKEVNLNNCLDRF